jgi:hypothetical protein
MAHMNPPTVPGAAAARRGGNGATGFFAARGPDLVWRWDGRARHHRVIEWGRLKSRPSAVGPCPSNGGGTAFSVRPGGSVRPTRASRLRSSGRLRSGCSHESMVVMGRTPVVVIAGWQTGTRPTPRSDHSAQGGRGRAARQRAAPVHRRRTSFHPHARSPSPVPRRRPPRSLHTRPKRPPSRRS